MAENFKRWFNQAKPDFILCTNYLGGLLIPDLAKAAQVDIPIYYYSADVFMSPQTGLSNKLAKLYISSQTGLEWVVAHGQDPKRAAVCPFPLQHQFIELRK